MTVTAQTKLLPAEISPQELSRLRRASRIENWKRSWFKFSRNPLSLIGAGTVILVVLMAVFAPLIAPYPNHVKPFTDFANASKPPSLTNLFGTDEIGRDILTRTIFGYRYSLVMGLVVLAIVVPVGVFLGLLAGYFQHSWFDTIIMRITDIFLAVPPLILALAIASILRAKPFSCHAGGLCLLVALVYPPGVQHHHRFTQ